MVLPICLEGATLEAKLKPTVKKKKGKKNKTKKQKVMKPLDNTEDEEFYDHVPIRLDDDLKNIEDRLLK
jgi:hypothetical protein